MPKVHRLGTVIDLDRNCMKRWPFLSPLNLCEGGLMMKRFFLFFLVFAVLVGYFPCKADSDDVVVGIELDEGENDLVIEDIEEPVEEVDLFLGEDLPEEIDLAGQEDLLYDLQGDVCDILAPENDEDEDVLSNSAVSNAKHDNDLGEFFTSASSVPEGFVIAASRSSKLMQNALTDLFENGTGKDENGYEFSNTALGQRGPSNGVPAHFGGWTCYAYANAVMYRLFGFYVDSYGGSVKKQGVRASALEGKKELYFADLKEAGIPQRAGTLLRGAVKRNNGGGEGHSIVILYYDHDSIYYIAGNDDGNGLVRICHKTWEEFNASNVFYNFYTKAERQIDYAVYAGDDLFNDLYPGVLIQKIELNNTNVSLNLSTNETIQLKSKISPEDASYKVVQWYSDNNAVAEVSSEGIIRPCSIGSATITCAAQDGSGITASCKVTVTNFKLNIDDLDMYIGQTYTLKGTVGKTKVSCTFKSSNSKVVSVDKKGKITAKNVKKTTKVTITATAPKKQGTATCIVTVHPKPTKLAIKQGKAKTLNIGDTLDLTTVFTPKDALGKVIWSTSHKKVATVSSSGKVKAVGEGVTTIEAEVTGAGDGSATIKITVVDLKKPTGIKISAPSKTVYMGETLKLTTTLSPKTAESTITWKSSNTKIAKVSKKGVVTPVKTGTATITATASKKSPKGKVVSATIKITVKKSTAPSSISVGTSKKTLHVGDQWQLDYKIKPAGAKASLTFSSSDETVATVNEKGVITANAKGSATITVVTQNNKKASCKITVLAEASGLQLDKESLSLNVGDTYQLTCFVSHGLSGSVTFSSSNAAVATVDANALITAVGVGEATITASMDNGAIATCAVTVSNPGVPTSITIDEADTLTLSVGQTYKLKAILEPATSTAEIHWMVDRDYTNLDAFWTDFLTVSANGTVTALKEGKITVYAMTKGADNKTLQDKIQVIIVPSNGKTQLYSDGILKLLGVINEHREKKTHMLTINPSLCDIAQQQLNNKLSGGDITLSSSEYGWYYHSDYSTASDGDKFLYQNLNMKMDLNSNINDGFCDPMYHEIGIATQYQSPWWVYGFYVLR